MTMIPMRFGAKGPLIGKVSCSASVGRRHAAKPVTAWSRKAQAIRAVRMQDLEGRGVVIGFVGRLIVRLGTLFRNAGGCFGTPERLFKLDSAAVCDFFGGTERLRPVTAFQGEVRKPMPPELYSDQIHPDQKRPPRRTTTVPARHQSLLQ